MQTRLSLWNLNSLYLKIWTYTVYGTTAALLYDSTTIRQHYYMAALLYGSTTIRQHWYTTALLYLRTSYEPAGAPLTDAYQPGAVQRNSEHWACCCTHIHKDPAVAAHCFIGYKIFCYCLQTMFQVGYMEGIAICISTSCPDAVNLKAKHNPRFPIFSHFLQQA